MSARGAAKPPSSDDERFKRELVVLIPHLRAFARTLTGDHTVREGYRLFIEIDGYRNFSGRLSAMTQIDVGGLARSIAALAGNPELRRTMGRAAARRARDHYDWGAVIPQMQDLWAEQSRIRGAAKGFRRDAQTLPVAPSPMRIFADYPTEARGFAGQTVAANPDRRHRPEDLFQLRGYARGREPFMTLASVVRIWTLVVSAQEGGVLTEELARLVGQSVVDVDRVLIWLLKYDFIRILS